MDLSNTGETRVNGGKQDVIPGTYLNVIPPELLTNIAKAMLHNRHKPDAIMQVRLINYDHVFPFVWNNELLRKAALEALNYKLTLHPYEEDSAYGIVEFFGNDLRELDLFRYHFDRVPRNLIHLPKLQAAFVHGTPQHLGVLKGCCTISRLKVNMAGNDCMESLVAVLKANPVSELTLYVTEYTSRFALKQHEWQKRLSLAGSSVKKFSLFSFMGQRFEYWTLVTGLKCLEILAIWVFEDPTLLSEKHMSFLKALKEVHLDNVKVDFSRALQLRASLRSMKICEFSSAADVAKLDMFTCLHSVNLVLPTVGAENGLLDVNVSNLKTLALQWELVNNMQLENMFEEDENGELLIFAQEEFEPEFYEPDRGCLLRIVERAIHLEELRLYDACISSGTMATILKQIGSRLARLHVTFDDKNESIPLQFEFLLRTISLYCHNVESMELDFTGEVLTTEEEMGKCIEALRRVQAFCPRFQRAGQIISNIRSFRIEG